MTLKRDAKFKGKLTRGLKNDIRNLVNFDASSRKSDICILMGSFCPKHIKFWMKKYGRVVSLDTLGSKNDMSNFVNFNASSGKSENLHIDVLLSSRVYYV